MNAVPLLPMRRRPAVVAGTVEHHATEPIFYWHRHDLHEIEYAVTGCAEMRTRSTHYLLPPRYAAWVPAGVDHAPLLRDVTTIAVFFDPAEFDFAHRRTAIIPVPAVLREMMRYAVRWPIDRLDDDDEHHRHPQPPRRRDERPEARPETRREARTFFHALADVVRRALAQELPMTLALPVSDDPVIRDVITYTAAHLDDVTSGAVCRAVGVSERVLRRRFAAEVGQSWSDHLRHARLLRAMALLSTSTRSVGEIAAAVGFGSASALARAFRAWTGEAPTDYRDRSLALDAELTLAAQPGLTSAANALEPAAANS